MTLVTLLRRWLVATPLPGKYAFPCAFAAVALPTLYRGAFEGMVMGIGYCPYIPAVLLSALLLGWRYATLVTLASMVVADALFVGPRFQVAEAATDMFGDVGFFIASAIIIALVQAIRTALEDLAGPAAGGGAFFSLKEGQVWASWPASGFHLRLGKTEDVTRMMQDFVAQTELGERLTRISTPTWTEPEPTT